ncbi:hypothetical protein BT96DRAFT_949175 [Gymnopus androsaceus JB14]|uniref:Uncharacterized protein n=1 Tax=Gymnopus androsaceus JB14 TaxID=1447944 RepID=A0A6A4GLL3_9AGAR|nr:hypothetical protein BT96DRAFT_949175 [Gymnopus androsaceus JB14]
MPLVGDWRICCQFYNSAALDYNERLTIIVPHICARFFRTCLDLLSLPICARQAVGVQFERRVTCFYTFTSAHVVTKKLLRRLASYSSAIHTLKITDTSRGLRLTRLRLTKSSPAIPLCPTFTPVGETLALSPTLANFALVLPILPENILVLASYIPENSALPPVVLSVIPMPWTLLHDVFGTLLETPNPLALYCTFTDSDSLRSSWAEPEDLEHYIFQ